MPLRHPYGSRRFFVFMGGDHNPAAGRRFFYQYILQYFAGAGTGISFS